MGDASIQGSLREPITRRIISFIVPSASTSVITMKRVHKKKTLKIRRWSVSAVLNLMRRISKMHKQLREGVITVDPKLSSSLQGVKRASIK